MTATADFQTNALYLGGEGKCKAGADDRYPASVDPLEERWMVNVSMAKIHEIMWNLEAWNTELTASWSITNDVPETTTGNLTVEGQFHYAFFEGLEDLMTGRVLKGEPRERVCGDYWQTTDDMGSGGGASPVDSEGAAEYLLPSIVGDLSYDNLNTSTVDIKDGAAASVGSLTFTKDWDSDWPWIGFDPYYIRLLGDGTADVFFNLYCQSANYIGFEMELTLFRNEEQYDDYAYYLKGEAVTVTILGEDVDCWLGFSDWTGSDPENSVLDSFTLTYDVDVTTAYSY